MGVQSLWQILAPVKSEETIECLKGKKIAVDLAIWLVESQVTGLKMMPGVTKPHLRNLFFRVSNFLKLGVQLVFVIDGTPPELKWEEMERRNELRLGGGGAARGGARGGWRGRGRGRGGGGGGAKKKSRSHFACWLKECQELLELMGVPCIQSKGEAEAMCAALNGSGMVDGCMTEDGDAFLYGARIVYRNLNMSTGKVDCYSMDDIEADLKLDRRRLVALSILLGCDYLPKGVPGVGKEVAMKFMRSISSSVDPLKLFLDWRGGSASTCLTNEERDVRKKSLRVEGFPNEDVIKEFLQNKERPPARDSEWKRPLLLYLQQFIVVKMEWVVEYTQEKVVPLLTLFDLTHTTSDPKGRLQPASVVKLRVRQGVQCVEVQWHKPDEDKKNEEDGDLFYTTVEDRQLFTSVYPHVMELFMVAKETKKAKGRGKKKKEASSSSQQDGGTEEEYHVVMDTASKHPPAGVDAPLNMDQEHLFKATTSASQVESCHGNQPRSRELPSLHETGRDVGRSRFPSREEVTHRHGDTDDKDMLMKLSSLSLQEVQEDGRTQRRTQDTEKKARPGKKCFKGKDRCMRSGKESLVGNDNEWKSQSLVSASALGARERKQTKKDILQVTEDDSTEEMEEVEESFIEVLPLSQRLGCSLRGFVPKSRKTANQVSSGVALKAAKSASHFSSDEESGLGVQKTLPQLSDEESLETNSGKIRPLDSNVSAYVVERTEHSSVACSESEEPSVASEHSAGSPQECIMDKRHYMPQDATEPIAELHTIDMLKLSPMFNQDSKVCEMHTSCKNFTPATYEIIDLTEDSPLNDKRMPAVYFAEDATIQSPRTMTLGVTSRSLGEKKDGDEHMRPEEEATYSQEKSLHNRLLQISKDHGNSSYSMKKDDSSFLKLDSSLAKFMEEISLVSNSSSVAVSFVEDNDSVFIVEDEEASLDNSKQKKTLEENNEEREEISVNLCQGTVQDSSNFQEKLLVSDVCIGVPDGINVVPKEQVTKESKHTAQGDMDDSTELPRRETKNVQAILDLKINSDQDSLTTTEQTMEVKMEDRELTRKDTKNANEAILDRATTASLDTSGSRAEEICEPQQREECNHEMGNLSNPLLLVKKAVKSRKGRVSKTKKKDKSMKSSSLHDSMLIENGLMKLLQMMSPVQVLANPRSREGEGSLSGRALEIDEPSSQSVSLALQEEKTCTEPICFSPSLKLPLASPSLLLSTALGPTLLDALNLPRLDSPANSMQAAPYLPEEPQAFLANSATRVPASPCTESSSQDSPAYSEQTASSLPEEPQAILANSDTGVCASLSTMLTSQDSTVDSEQTASSTPEEPQAILANSDTEVHVSPCTKTSMPHSPTNSERTASIIPKEPCAMFNSATEFHVSPCTNSSGLLRAQLMSMLSQLTPGDSPLIGSKMLKKPQDFVPFRLRHQKANGKGKRQISSQPLQADPNTCRDIVKLSNQENLFEVAIPDETDGMPECSSDNSKVSVQRTNECTGDKSELGRQGTQRHGSRIVTQPQSTDEPKLKPKPRTLSQPTRTVPSAKRNIRSKHKSCSQPVRSHSRSRSKSSAKGSQRRESMLAMESSLAKILEGLSI